MLAATGFQTKFECCGLTWLRLTDEESSRERNRTYKRRRTAESRRRPLRVSEYPSTSPSPLPDNLRGLEGLPADFQG